MINKFQKQILWSGKTQRQIGKEANIAAERISDYLYGGRPMPPNHMLAFCKVLKCNPEDIVGFEDFPEISVRVG